MSQKKNVPNGVSHDVLRASIKREHLMPTRTKEFSDIIEEHPTFFTIIAALLIIELDLLSGEDIEFPILFAIPVALAAWGLKSYLAYSLSILLPLLRVGFVLFLWERSQALHVLAINAIITVMALLGYAYLTTKISQRKKRLEEKAGSLGED